MKYGVFSNNLVSDGFCLKNQGKRVVTLERFREMCLKEDILITKADIDSEYKQAVKELYEPPSADQEKGLMAAIKESLSKEEVFQGFLNKGNKTTTSLIYYKVDEFNSLCLGSSTELGHKAVYSILSSKKIFSRILEKWTNILSPYAKSLKLKITDTRRIVEIMWEEMYNAVVEMPYEEVDFSAPPAIIEGFGKGTEYTIPFKQQKVTLNDLNPVLKDFLERLVDREYLCAIIAGRLIGFRCEYVPWIYGSGGEGKSTFIRFLSLLVPGGSASFKLEDTNGLWDAMGKTFLFFSDTSNKNLLHYEQIKNISGGDAVVISGKYKHARTEILPGLIIITSNKYPTIGSSKAIKRRAKVFTVEGRSKTEKKLTVEDAAKEMMKSSNEFLNYCIQCLSEVGDKETGEIRNHMSNFGKGDERSPDELEFEDFIERVKLSFNDSLSIKGSELRGLLENKVKINTPYFRDNFLDYIKYDKGVSYIDGWYFGVGKINMPHVTEIDRESRIKALLEKKGEKNA